MGTTSQSVSFVRARSDIRSFRTTGAPRKTIYLNGESKVINCPITDVGGDKLFMYFDHAAAVNCESTLAGRQASRPIPRPRIPLSSFKKNPAEELLPSPNRDGRRGMAIYEAILLSLPSYRLENVGILSLYYQDGHGLSLSS